MTLGSYDEVPTSRMPDRFTLHLRLWLFGSNKAVEHFQTQRLLLCWIRNVPHSDGAIGAGGGLRTATEGMEDAMSDRMGTRQLANGMSEG